MLTLTLILIFIITVASTWWFGLWSNLISLINVLLAGMIATSFYENTTYEMNLHMETFGALLPFVALWLLFATSFIILRGITDTLSSMRLKFDPITELVGRSLLSILLAIVFVSFVSFTLQLAPLRESLFSGTQNSVRGAPLGPDQLWINFIRGCSNGSLSYTAEETQFFPPFNGTQTVNGVETQLTVRTFDPANTFFMDAAGLRSSTASRSTLRIPPRSQAGR